MGSAPLVAGLLVWTIAFASYARTLLPGVDLGDTGGFQAAVLWPEISARQAYPLFYALARPFVAALSAADPARGLNLFSAACGAAAAGVLTGVVTAVTRSAVGGAAAGLLLAFSYTFWTQAVIAEVYALHLALVGLCLAALAAYASRPGTGRLAAFFAIYALAFGNHLSMILLFAPFAAFLLLTADRPAALVQPRIVLLAAAIATAGSLQYLPQLASVWTSPEAPPGAADRLAAFWMDVTKSDWRDSMVLGVRSSDFGGRLAMLAFDARQQFGLIGLGLALLGLVGLWRAHRPWAVLVALAYAVNTLFAFTYNVGDPHVFFMPGHYFVAFAAGAGAAAATARIGQRAVPLIAAAAVLGYALWRGYDTWPAVDRHADRRAEQLIGRLTLGLNGRNALLVEHLNWQVENALLYETRYRHRHVVWTRLNDVFLHLPLLVRDNLATGRDVVLTADAAPEVADAFGGLFPLLRDPLLPAPSLATVAARLPRGTPYALAILPPPRGEALDEEALAAALERLTGAPFTRRRTPYEVIVGRAGERPLLHAAEARPFRRRLQLAEGTVDVRMDGWVAIETFRRGGFGHVVFNRRHVLIVERGVSFAALDDRTPAPPFYAAGLYALQPRFRIPAGGAPQLALLD